MSLKWHLRQSLFCKLITFDSKSQSTIFLCRHAEARAISRWFLGAAEFPHANIVLRDSLNYSVVATKSNKTETSQVGAISWLKNIQGTTIGNIWKKINFFSKKIFGKKSRTMPKNLKRGHLGSFNVFYKPKTSKKMQGGTL